jgi:D-alanine-D-alanine ligase
VDAARCERLALAAWRGLGGRDAGRIDLREDAEGRLQVLEVNPLPGLHPTHSDLPMIWSATGRSYRDLIERIVVSAAKRVAVRVTARAGARHPHQGARPGLQ